MPLLRNAKKALRSSLKKAQMNRRVKSQARTMMTSMRTKPTSEGLSAAFSAIDRAVKKHLFHKNKAARLKSQLSGFLKTA